MTAEEILRIRNLGETSTVQFKERIEDAYKLGCEFVAFCNSLGGKLFVGTVNELVSHIALWKKSAKVCPYADCKVRLIHRERYCCH